MPWKFFLANLLIIAFLVGCSRDSGKTIVISWQHAKQEVCLGCKKPGLDEDGIKSAAKSLEKRLTDKGIKVKWVEKDPDPKAPAGTNDIWVCDIPVATWLGGQVATRPCCQGSVSRSMALDGRTYEVIPAELVVRAGLSAADMLIEQGKIDPTKLKARSGCSGCPSAGGCPGARAQ
jgi:hypothetical protein